MPWSNETGYDQVNFQSIKIRIVAFCVALLLIGTLMRNFIGLPIFQGYLRELIASQQMSIATYVARDIDDNITSRLALIDRFAGELPPALAGQPQQLQAWIKDRQQVNSWFNGCLFAVRPDGKLLAQYPAVHGQWQLDLAAEDWFRAALHASKPVIGRPSRGHMNGDQIIVFAAPVRDGTGGVVAVLAGVARLSTPGFLDRIQQTRLGVTGGFLLISPADHLFVASSDSAMNFQPTPPPGVNLLHDRAMSGYRGTGITVNAKGVEELSSMVTVPSTNWFLVARISTEEAFRPIEKMRGFMFKASLALLFGLVAILLIALPRILRPLTDAAHAMRAMADGKSKLMPLPVVKEDEVGELVNGFNFLVERLRKEEAAREASEARLKFMAHHDSLTGLYNRAMLEERLEHALACVERDGSQIALLFCDLDGFKPINDQHGHHAGDAVLRQVARRLSDGRRQVDTVARLGGDEFVILLTGLTDASAAANVVAQQCLTAVSEPFEFEGTKLALGMSVGIATHSGHTITASYLIAQADIAMYQAKRKGKGKIFFMEEVSAVDSGHKAASNVAKHSA